MFVCFQNWRGPEIYSLRELTPTQVRKLTRGSRKSQARIRDRTMFVQTIRYTPWTESHMDLSAEVLQNRRSEVLPGMPSIAFYSIKACIEIEYSEDAIFGSDPRRACYKTLLNAYFKATHDLDMTARSEPNCSDEARRLIIERIAEYANPARELLLRMMDSQMRGLFSSEYGTFKDKINKLVLRWDSSQAALEASKEFTVRQADNRVMVLLTHRSSI